MDSIELAINGVHKQGPQKTDSRKPKITKIFS